MPAELVGESANHRPAAFRRETRAQRKCFEKRLVSLFESCCMAGHVIRQSLTITCTRSIRFQEWKTFEKKSAIFLFIVTAYLFTEKSRFVLERRMMVRLQARVRIETETCIQSCKLDERHRGLGTCGTRGSPRTRPRRLFNGTGCITVIDRAISSDKGSPRLL
jgi:hypothetical protein